MVIKYFLKRKHQFGGRNKIGKITLRGRGGGNKKLIRVIDFRNILYDIEGEVYSIEYDPMRNAKIALVLYQIGCISYVLVANLVQVTDKIMSSYTKRLKIKSGNSMLLQNMPLGSSVFNIEDIPGNGGKTMRSAGMRAILFQRFKKFSSLILPSNKLIYRNNFCMATLGCVSNKDFKHMAYRKAGYLRNLGFRPKVRGVAMNTNDHIHGGGHCISSSYNGKIIKGKKTRFKLKNQRFFNFCKRIVGKRVNLKKIKLQI